MKLRVSKEALNKAVYVIGDSESIVIYGNPDTPLPQLHKISSKLSEQDMQTWLVRLHHTIGELTERMRAYEEK